MHKAPLLYHLTSIIITASKSNLLSSYFPVFGIVLVFGILQPRERCVSLMGGPTSDYDHFQLAPRVEGDDPTGNNGAMMIEMDIVRRV